MSEHGWHDFLAAEGVHGRVGLHGGATAVFGVASLSDGRSRGAGLRSTSARPARRRDAPTEQRLG
jgi:hypothetical protein